MKYQVCVVSGTRADYGPLRPLLLRLRDCPEIELTLAATGSHLSAAFGGTQDELARDGFSYDSVPIPLEDDSKAAFWEYYAARCWALDELCARYEELLDMQAAGHDDLQLLDDQPFERIYGGSGTDFRLVSACVSLLALCLTIPGVFWLERNHGMELLLHSTAAGRTRLWRWKAVLALCVSIGIWLIWSGYELFQFRSLGGSWDACPANADSLFYWDSHLGSTPLLVYLIGFYAFRLVGLLSAASVTLWISSRLPAMLPAAGISALVLLVPVLLTQLGAPSLEYVSWAAKLAGDGLAVRWADVLCFGVWTVLGITALVASRHQWLRYRG